MKFDERRPLHRVVGNRELPRAKKVGFMGDATHPLRVIMAQPLTIASYAISDELGARKRLWTTAMNRSKQGRYG